jgi:hypothetical protein
LPRRQAQAEYVAGGGNWIAESPYYRSLPTFIDDITRDFGSDAYERVMLDDQVASSVRTYVESILSDPLTVRPWIDDDKDPDYEQSKQYAEFAERLLANCSPMRSVDAWLYEMASGAVSLGNRVAEKVARLEESGQDAGRLVWDRVKVKPRNRTAFVVDGFSNLLGLLAAIPGQGNLVPDAILTPDLLAVSNLLPREKFAILSWNPQEEDPRGTSLLRNVYKLWWEKIQATGEWLRHLTQFGSPSLWGTTAPNAMAEPATDSQGNVLPGAASITPVQQLLNEFLKFRNGYALALPNGATVQLLQSANAGDAFLKMIEHHERAIDRAILLAARTRMEAKHGSKADSETSQDITGQAVRRAKTWVADMVTRDIIRPMILWNFGPDAAKRLCPYASLAPVEHQDWSQTANAVAPLVSVGFLKPSQFAAMYDKLGLPPAEEPLTDDQQQDATPPPAPGDEDFPAGNPDEAPFASGEYQEPLHPRGYGGKWVDKAGSSATPLHAGSLAAVLDAHLQEMSQKLQMAIRESKTRKELLERAAGLWQDPSLKVWPAMGEQRAKALANRLPQPPWGGDTKSQERLLVSLGKDFGKFAQAAVRDFAEDFQSEARSGLVDAGRQGLSQRAAELPSRLHQAWEDAWAGLGQDWRGAFHDDWGEKLHKALTRAPDLATAQQRFQKLAGVTLDPGSAKDVHDYADEPLSRWLDIKANEVLPGTVQEFWQALAGRKAPANWAEFADYQEPLHPRGYGGKWASKGTDQTHEQHTEQLTWRGKVASLLRQALSQPGKSVARVLAAAEALHDAYRQGGFKAVPKVAVVAAYRKAKVSFAKLESRYGRKAAIAMAGAYLSCYAAYAANPVLMLYLPSPTAAILGTAEALRALGKGARKLAGKKGEAVFAHPDILPVDLEDFLDSLPDDVEFAFGLPTPYEEGKHPRGYGGKWTNKPGAGRFAAAGKAHQTAEKELQKHERALARSAAKLEKLKQSHEAAKATHAATKKRVPKGKPHGREALEAHKAELAAIRAKGKLDAHKAAHAEARQAHRAVQAAHGKTGKELAKAQAALEKEPKEPKKPARKPAVKKLAAETQGAIPDGPQLEKGQIKSLGDVEGTSVFHRVTVAGKPYFVKEIDPQLKERETGYQQEAQTTLRNETAVADLARIAGVATPAARSVTFQGKPALVTPWLEGQTIDRASGRSLKKEAELIDALPAREVADHILFAYLADVSDRHSGNYLIQDGKLTSIDHEFSFATRGESSAARARNAITDNTLFFTSAAPGRGADLPIKESLNHFLGKAPQMEDFLRQLGLKEAADVTRYRAGMLAKVKGEKNPTLHHLLEAIGREG